MDEHLPCMDGPSLPEPQKAASGCSRSHQAIRPPSRPWPLSSSHGHRMIPTHEPTPALYTKDAPKASRERCPTSTRGPAEEAVSLLRSAAWEGVSTWSGFKNLSPPRLPPLLSPALPISGQESVSHAPLPGPQHPASGKSHCPCQGGQHHVLTLCARQIPLQGCEQCSPGTTMGP